MALGYQELLIIFGILLLLFGGSRVPQLAKGIGKSLRAFKEGHAEGEREWEQKEATRRERLRDADPGSHKEDEIAFDKATASKPRSSTT